ncbi:phosphotransferase [Halobaculum sp. WSA2]|uniref:Phosphotransferase n=1 Tax=Halobaculum saliterrae TaxID=2073113 RepID=A0A6B0SSE4_9EURY|nr:phosphotransferase [Halobaculum saliterrae]MXR41868.1 phosphotransferase [Halobaculum saliterrae]
MDITAGTGRRTGLLAEQCESVVALGQSVDRLRILSNRTDLPTDSVVPIHGSLSEVPLAPGTFDTIVADLASLRDDVDRLSLFSTIDTLLSKRGTAFVLTEGVIQADGVADSVRRLRSVQRALHGNGGPIKTLQIAKAYGLYPSPSCPDYALDPTKRDEMRRFQTLELTARTITERAGKQILTLLRRLGLLQYALPGYLLVFSRQREPTTTDLSGGLILRGRYRSTLFDSSTDGADRIYKVPNVTTYEQFNNREQETLEYVRSTNDEITGTLPTGTRIETQFGNTRSEQQVQGTQLRNRVKRSPGSFQWVLRTGLNWIARLQQPYCEHKIERTPTEVQEFLSNSTVGIEVPAPPEPISSFETVVHGDFNQVNVFVDDTGITGVIDWEYAATAGSPFIDPTNFLLTLGVRTFGDIDTAVDRLFLQDSPFARITTEELTRYGEQVGMDPVTIVRHLPAGLQHRISVNYSYPTSLSLITIPETFAVWGRKIAGELPAIVQAVSHRAGAVSPD